MTKFISEVPSEKGALNKTEIPFIQFLNLDGSLSEDDYHLNDANTQFISVRDHEVFGKIETFEDSHKEVCYLKTYRGGRPGEIVPDPYGHFFRATDLSTTSRQKGDRFCEYLQVKQEIFVTYRDYLLTRNPVLFNSVDKALKDGERL